MKKWKLVLRSLQKFVFLTYVMSANGSSQQASLRSERSAQKSSSLKIPGQDMSNLENSFCDGFYWKLPDGEYPLRISSLSTWFPIVKLIWCRKKSSKKDFLKFSQPLSTHPRNCISPRGKGELASLCVKRVVGHIDLLKCAASDIRHWTSDWTTQFTEVHKQMCHKDLTRWNINAI